MWSSDHWVGQFFSMASLCEVLIEDVEERIAREMLVAIAECAWQIEARYSRYRSGNLVHRINTANGAPVELDEEAANLIDFAARLTQLSGGAFDITCGILRKAWTFDGSDRVPTRSQVDELLPFIGWDKVRWQRPILQLRPGMQIDFGGIGKEYAVDRAAALADALAPNVSCLVNFGGDIAVRHPRRDGKPWCIGIEACDAEAEHVGTIRLRSGAVATSGDSKRFLLKDGKRYSHVLDARTGWPVENAPRSVTVLADTCTQAGTFATLALLAGADARSFLEAQRLEFWLQG